MSKLSLIISREYLSRVKKKSFILTTVLTPVGFLIFWIALIFIFSSGKEDKRILVLDTDNLLQTNRYGIENTSQLSFHSQRDSTRDIGVWKESYKDKDYDILLHIPSQISKEELEELKTVQIDYYSQKQLGVSSINDIQKILAKHIRKLKMDKAGIDVKMLKKFDTDINLNPKVVADTQGTEQSKYKVYVASFLGGIMMFLIYIVIFIYGNMVMRSVMEEKTNRIVEVIISSVKPFPLMLGKIIGVGAVGLTQFAVWAVVIPLMYLGMGILFSGKLVAIQDQLNSVNGQNMQGLEDVGELQLMLQELSSFNYSSILFFFVLFFLGGYILYSSLFAAIGAAMGDDWGEGQSLTLIVAMPVLIGFYIGAAAIENPDSALAFWGSIFPLFAPVVMPARIAFDPPLWEIILSLFLLLLNCIFFVWIAGRIYRVGILMYGKKITAMNMLKWIFIKK